MSRWEVLSTVGFMEQCGPKRVHILHAATQDLLQGRRRHFGLLAAWNSVPFQHCI